MADDTKRSDEERHGCGDTTIKEQRNAPSVKFLLLDVVVQNIFFRGILVVAIDKVHPHGNP